jgi:hypothetical protein
MKLWNTLFSFRIIALYLIVGLALASAPVGCTTGDDDDDNGGDGGDEAGGKGGSVGGAGGSVGGKGGSTEEKGGTTGGAGGSSGGAGGSTAGSGGAAGTTATGCAPGALSSLDTGTSGKTVEGGTIAADTTWKKSDSPITVAGEIRIEGSTSPKLTIEPGVVVRFQDGARLTIGYGAPGSLIAQGTKESPILLTAASNKKAGAWPGIDFYPQTVSGQSKLSYVTIEYGGDAAAGAVRLYSSAVLFEQVTVRDSESVGIQADSKSEFAEGSTCINAIKNGTFGITMYPDHVASIPELGTYTENKAGAVEVQGGMVERTATWGNIGEAYIISEEVRVEGTLKPVLTITEGTKIAFNKDAQLTMGYGNDGALTVKGTQTSPVLFTSSQTTKAKGDWDGLWFYDKTTDGSTKIEWAEIAYAGSHGETWGGINIDNAKVTLSHVKIHDSVNCGLSMVGSGQLDSASTALTVTSNDKFAVSTTFQAATTLPSADSDYSGNTAGGVNIETGYVETTATLRAINAPYSVDYDIRVEGSTNPVLTVEAGITMKFNGATGLQIGYSKGGGIKAIGTAEKRIVFTSNGDQTPGYWDGLHFWDSTLDSNTELKYVTVEYGGGTDGANIYVDGAAPVISETTVTKSAGYGIKQSCSDNTQGVRGTNITYTDNAQGAHNDDADCGGSL